MLTLRGRRGDLADKVKIGVMLWNMVYGTVYRVLVLVLVLEVGAVLTLRERRGGLAL